MGVDDDAVDDANPRRNGNSGVNAQCATEQAADVTGPRPIERPKRCPECGFETHGSRPTPNAGTLLRIVIPWGVVILAALALAVWLEKGAQTNMIGSGTHSPMYTTPAMTLADIRAFESGSSPAEGASLYDAVMRDQPVAQTFLYPGTRTLEIGFTTESRLRQSMWTLGWPLPWYCDWRFTMYRDAARRIDRVEITTDPTQMSVGPNTSITPDGKFATRPRWSWQFMGIAYRPPPEETAGVSVWKDLYLMGVVSSLGLALLAGCIVASVVWIIRRVVRRTDRPRASTRRIGLIAACLAIVGMVIVSLITIEHSDVARMPSAGITIASRMRPQPGLNTLSSTVLDEPTLRRMADDADRDQRLASAILAASHPQLADESALLVTVLQPEAIMTAMSSTSTRYNPTIGLFARYDQHFVRRPVSVNAPMGPTGGAAAGEAMTFPPGWTWHLGNGSVRLTHSTGDPNDAVRAWTINLQWLGIIAMALALL